MEKLLSLDNLSKILAPVQNELNGITGFAHATHVYQSSTHYLRDIAPPPPINSLVDWCR